MHSSALNFGKQFFDTYCLGLQDATVYDVGAQNVNGSLKDVLPPNLRYVGVDFVAGNGVDIVLEDPYKLPFADESLDVLVCSSCFEHSQFFWLVFLEMLRVLKPKGLLYLNVPSNGSIHRYPVDCWRFYPDSGGALEAWAARNGYAAQLMESFVGARSPDSYESGGAWHDFVAVFVKDGQHAAAYSARMLDTLPTYSNGYDSRTGVESRSEFLSPDHAALLAHEHTIVGLNQEIARIHQEHSLAEERMASMQQSRHEELVHRIEELRLQVTERDEYIEQRDQRIAALMLQALQSQQARRANEVQLRAAHARIEEILHSHSWRAMAPARKIMGIVKMVLSGVRAPTARLGSAEGSPGDYKTEEVDSALIRASGQFDEAFYRLANPDLPADIDSIAHYCEHGWREGRDPSPRFSTRHYLNSNPGIREGGVNPFAHYIIAGASGGRQTWPVANRERASACNPSEATADPHIEPELHSPPVLASGDATTEPSGELLYVGIAAEVAAIRASGMFDESYYRSEYLDLASILDPIRHYCERGWREGRNPSPDFDTAFYLKVSPDIRDAGMNPFLHYVKAGMAENRPAHPQGRVRRTEEMVVREAEEIRSSGKFDEAFYRVMNGDIQPPPVDAIRHYCERGWLEGRNPSDDFDTKAYLATYRDIREAGINPFWHYVVAGASELRKTHLGPAMRYEDQIRFRPMPSGVKLLAFYASPDWGTLRGHRSAVKGDAQLLLPHDDLGFYDVTNRAILKTQVALAKHHGIHGFCFALSAEVNAGPSTSALEGLLEMPEVDIAICVVLDMDGINCLISESSLLRRVCMDQRAIRIDGRPLLLVRPSGVSNDIREQLWNVRRGLIDQGIGPVFLVACWVDGDLAVLADACSAGACDAVLDSPSPLIPRESDNYQLLKSGSVLAAPYSVVAAQGVARIQATGNSEFPLYTSISVGYDNTSTKSDWHVVYKRFQTLHYRRWLDAAIEGVRSIPIEDRRFVFLQSWNDWNEGQVLEPDRHGGYSRLNETSRALHGIRSGLPMPKVSVIVPNYNHEVFLRKRLDSIYGQTYGNIEVILMDDCSSDGSRVVLDEYAAVYPDITKILYNETNSGGPFRQWAKGIGAATGDLIWIAESDDFCDERFLEVLVPSFDDEAVLLAYGDNVFVDRNGVPMAQGFQDYLNDLECADKWSASYVETAHREVRMALGIKNTIPNASSVLFRKPLELPLLNQPWWQSMRVAGDWVFYLHLLRGGKIAFNPVAKNYFRRYVGSTAETTYQKQDFYREVGLACCSVAALYDVPLAVLERCRDGFKEFYQWKVGRSEGEFAEWFDFGSVLEARTARVPNVMVSTMGFFPGGAEIFPIRLANEFKRQGVSVLLLSSGLAHREDGVRRMLRNDVPVVETSEVEAVKAAIEDFGIEVLNTHQWHIQKYPVQLPDVFARLQSHVATLHGMIEHGTAFAVTEDELRAADRSVSTWVYTADKNLGPFVGFGMVQEHRSRFVKMPNGIQTPSLEPVPRANLDIPEDAFVLCCVSRAIPDKGWAETIASVQRAREMSGQDIRLVLVGNGPVYDDYRQAGVPNFVHLVGFSDNSAGHYASADMGIMLTRFRSESFPLTIVDCLFAGKPYIATDVGDIRNMLAAPEGVAGQVIELEDWQVPVEIAAQAIASFATNKQLYLDAKALVPQIASRYRIESVAALYIDLFRRGVAAPIADDKRSMLSRA